MKPLSFFLNASLTSCCFGSIFPKDLLFVNSNGNNTTGHGLNNATLIDQEMDRMFHVGKRTTNDVGDLIPTATTTDLSLYLPASNTGPCISATAIGGSLLAAAVATSAVSYFATRFTKDKHSFIPKRMKEFAAHTKKFRQEFGRANFARVLKNTKRARKAVPIVNAAISIEPEAILSLGVSCAAGAVKNAVGLIASAIPVPGLAESSSAVNPYTLHPINGATAAEAVLWDMSCLMASYVFDRPPPIEDDLDDYVFVDPLDDKVFVGPEPRPTAAADSPLPLGDEDDEFFIAPEPEPTATDPTPAGPEPTVTDSSLALGDDFEEFFFIDPVPIMVNPFRSILEFFFDFKTEEHDEFFTAPELEPTATDPTHADFTYADSTSADEECFDAESTKVETETTRAAADSEVQRDAERKVDENADGKDLAESQPTRQKSTNVGIQATPTSADFGAQTKARRKKTANQKSQTIPVAVTDFKETMPAITQTIETFPRTTESFTQTNDFDPVKFEFQAKLAKADQIAAKKNAEIVELRQKLAEAGSRSFLAEIRLQLAKEIEERMQQSVAENAKACAEKDKRIWAAERRIRKLESGFEFVYRDAKLRKLANSVAERDEVIRNAEQRAAELDLKLANATAISDEKNARILELETRLAHATAAADRKDREIAELRQTGQHSAEVQKELAHTNMNLQDHLRNSEQHAAELDKKLTDALNATADRHTRLRDSEQRSAAFEKKLEDATAAVEQKDDEIARLCLTKQRAAGLEKELANTVATAKSLNAKLYDSEQRSAALEKKLDAAAANAAANTAALNAQLRESEQRSAELEKRLAETTSVAAARVTETEAKLRDLGKKLAEVTAAAAARFTQKDAEINRLKAALDTTEESLKFALDSHAEVDQKLTTALAAAARNFAEIARLRNALACSEENLSLVLDAKTTMAAPNTTTVKSKATQRPSPAPKPSFDGNKKLVLVVRHERKEEPKEEGSEVGEYIAVQCRDKRIWVPQWALAAFGIEPITEVGFSKEKKPKIPDVSSLPDKAIDHLCLIALNWRGKSAKAGSTPLNDLVTPFFEEWNKFRNFLEKAQKVVWQREVTKRYRWYTAVQRLNPYFDMNKGDVAKKASIVRGLILDDWLPYKRPAEPRRRGSTSYDSSSSSSSSSPSSSSSATLKELPGPIPTAVPAPAPEQVTKTESSSKNNLKTDLPGSSSSRSSTSTPVAAANGPNATKPGSSNQTTLETDLPGSSSTATPASAADSTKNAPAPVVAPAAESKPSIESSEEAEPSKSNRRRRNRRCGTTAQTPTPSTRKDTETAPTLSTSTAQPVPSGASSNVQASSSSKSSEPSTQTSDSKGKGRAESAPTKTASTAQEPSATSSAAPQASSSSTSQKPPGRRLRITMSGNSLVGNSSKSSPAPVASTSTSALALDVFSSAPAPVGLPPNPLPNPLQNHLQNHLQHPLPNLQHPLPHPNAPPPQPPSPPRRATPWLGMKRKDEENGNAQSPWKKRILPVRPELSLVIDNYADWMNVDEECRAVGVETGSNAVARPPLQQQQQQQQPQQEDLMNVDDEAIQRTNPEGRAVSVEPGNNAVARPPWQPQQQPEQRPARLIARATRRRRPQRPSTVANASPSVTAGMIQPEERIGQIEFNIRRNHWMNLDEGLSTLSLG
ncbi:hypothetical protein HDU97_001879 [Phlyctochytrium planicorne]|nr:hypothetical protein HDU97_001879 [Phlyctochytrium planicorne]